MSLTCQFPTTPKKKMQSSICQWETFSPIFLSILLTIAISYSWNTRISVPSPGPVPAIILLEVLFPFTSCQLLIPLSRVQVTPRFNPSLRLICPSPGPCPRPLPCTWAQPPFISVQFFSCIPGQGQGSKLEPVVIQRLKHLVSSIRFASSPNNAPQNPNPVCIALPAIELDGSLEALI